MVYYMCDIQGAMQSVIAEQINRVIDSSADFWAEVVEEFVAEDWGKSFQISDKSQKTIC